MSMEWISGSNRRLSPRRIVAITVALGCHLGLFVVMLRPATYHRNTPSVATSGARALEVRFVPPTRKIIAQTVPTLRQPVAARSDDNQKPAKSRLVPLPAREATRLLPTRDETAATAAAAPPPNPAPPTAAPLSSQGTGSESIANDGGFQERLRHAQQANDVHGVPGSDRHVAPGIQLTDPMNQGVGAVMRKTQRLFGITDSHCMDVEVWEHLTAEERIARHISPGELKAINEKYECSKPLGLSF